MHFFFIVILVGCLGIPALAQVMPEKEPVKEVKIPLDLVQPPLAQKSTINQPIQLITSQNLPIKRPKAIFCRMEDAMTKGLKRKVKLGVEGS